VELIYQATQVRDTMTVLSRRKKSLAMPSPTHHVKLGGGREVLPRLRCVCVNHVADPHGVAQAPGPHGGTVGLAGGVQLRKQGQTIAPWDASKTHARWVIET
jgi:hypothetical protein